MDHFLEHFIFDVKDFEDVLNCEDARTMTQCFIEKVEKTLHKGSFECLLKVLKDSTFDIVVEELETGLPPGNSSINLLSYYYLHQVSNPTTNNGLKELFWVHM